MNDLASSIEMYNKFAEDLHRMVGQVRFFADHGDPEPYVEARVRDIIVNVFHRDRLEEEELGVTVYVEGYDTLFDFSSMNEVIWFLIGIMRNEVDYGERIR